MLLQTILFFGASVCLAVLFSRLGKTLFLRFYDQPDVTGIEFAVADEMLEVDREIKETYRRLLDTKKVISQIDMILLDAVAILTVYKDVERASLQFNEVFPDETDDPILIDLKEAFDRAVDFHSTYDVRFGKEDDQTLVQISSK